MTQTQKSGKKENGIFGISASRGFRKVIICHIFAEKKSTKFNAQKQFSAPLAPDFIMTGACQLSPFPETPPQFLGALLTPPPPEVKIRHALSPPFGTHVQPQHLLARDTVEKGLRKLGTERGCVSHHQMREYLTALLTTIPPSHPCPPLFRPKALPPANEVA